MYTGLLAIFTITALLNFPCNKASHSCAVLKPNFLKRINEVMVAERFVFIADFMKFCSTFERGRDVFYLLVLTTGAINAL